MGQTQSAEVGVDDIDILGRLAEHEGPIAMSENISTAEHLQPTVSYHGDVEDLLINVPLYA
jgi:hypothetical protein